MQEFLGKVPYGWWDLFRSRCMASCGWTYEQWKNRVANRTQLTPAERNVLETEFEKLKNEMSV